jgi:5-methylcytosine-specific restriction endonuclease McrA
MVRIGAADLKAEDDIKCLTMRNPCKYCGEIEGFIVTRNGQDCVHCVRCEGHQYNAPRTETGRKVRTVSTVHDAISSKQRKRIILRASGRCEMCGAKYSDDTGLHVGHLISVENGVKQGLTDRQINSDENLSAMCAQCNLGLGSETVPLWMATAIIRARTPATQQKGSPKR